MPSITNYYEEIKRLRFQKPFRPYTIVTRDGQKHHVFESVRAGSNGRSVTVIGKRDHVSRFNLTEISAVVEDKPKRRKRRAG